ncbi:uncharacterized protein LOC126836878 [Adelges cooleyi]|uniref:uncharacterized protein LOC126836878 n=1 Tax=Adelges cooleyi TaxID=133065 RepID=UPI0021809682|nr:uncharacterized protein LOC126836878 [Adelges cooleyi]
MIGHNIMILICIEMITAPATKPPTYYPNLPMGEYKFKIKAASVCEHFEHAKLQINFYVSRTNATTYVMKGNFTYLIPFDDSMSLTLSFAKRGSIGGWAENFHIYSTPKACSKLNWIMGSIFSVLKKQFNWTGCPIKPGVYATSEIDMEKFKDNNFPKVFFYGEYKLKISITSSIGETLGCSNYYVDILRPWEV